MCTYTKSMARSFTPSIPWRLFDDWCKKKRKTLKSFFPALKINPIKAKRLGGVLIFAKGKYRRLCRCARVCMYNIIYSCGFLFHKHLWYFRNMHSAVAPGVICITEEKQSRVNPIHKRGCLDERARSYRSHRRGLKLFSGRVRFWNGRQETKLHTDVFSKFGLIYRYYYLYVKHTHAVSSRRRW